MSQNKQEASTITRSDLAESVYKCMGLSRVESNQLVEMVIDEITSTLIKGENVKLSSFGSFLVRSKSKRVGRNPKTGVEVTIEPRKVLVFKPGAVMKNHINGKTK